GSTGTPKVVSLAPDGVDRFQRWADERFDLGPGRIVLNYAPLNFDLCLLDVWATLAAGGCVRLVDPAKAVSGRHVAELLDHDQPHVIQAVPLCFRLLAQERRGLVF